MKKTSKILRKGLSLFGMRFRPYKNPDKVGGWLGWIETRRGKCLGFIRQDGRIVFDW